ncbi:hypothetical protein HY491_02850, partial [Candidatus Woesearchaeota archaeon]|nr:hypothetical protein [Candidatus Woesearchaeota archaeon]
MQPQNSLIVSLATGCLPGVIYNLDKARQIECTYAYCLENNVEQGIPSFACTSVRSSSWCKYVYGEIFRVISPLAMADYMLSQIKELLSDPIGLVSAVSCEVFPPFSNTLTQVCTKASYISVFTDVMNSIRTFRNFNFQKEVDVCSLLKKE